jgi:hypothetical protein|tara:strand:- start:65901 stop:66131 length:231 start_codon:yes stop_codon:yes gene_type:complete
VKTVVSRRHFAVGDHVEPDKSELRFRNEFYGFDVNVRVDTPMILGTLLFGFEFEFDGTWDGNNLNDFYKGNTGKDE